MRDLVVANHILANEGVLDAFGHVSMRNPGMSGQFLISRSRGPERVAAEDLQRFDLEGRELNRDSRAAYAERAIHAAIYRARPEVMAICHNHSPAVIPFGATNVPLRPVFHMAGLLGKHVPIWDIRDDFGATGMLVVTRQQGESLARSLGQQRVALMRGHGSVVVGESLQQVVWTSVHMEHNARLQMQSIFLAGPEGTVRYLSDAEIEATWEWIAQPHIMERAWDTWAARVGEPTTTDGHVNPPD